MSTTMTLLQLRDAVRQRADMVNSQFCTDAELNSYINQSYFELYDLLVQKYGDNYYVAPPLSFATDGTSFQFPLPDGTLYSAAPALYKLLGVDLSVNGSPDGFITLRPFTFSDRNRATVPNFQSFYARTNLTYRLNGTNIWFEPIPSGGQTIRLWYVPRMTTLAADGDIADGISGWTEYIILDATIKAKVKEESDVQAEFAQKQALIQRLEAAAENRDAGNPAVVADSRRNDTVWDGGYSNGSGFY